MSSRKRVSNGSGSVWKRKDGRWEGALYILEADGRRVRRSFYAGTRAEADGKLVELRGKVEAGLPMTPAQLTVQSFLTEWLDQIVSKRVRPNTLAAYRYYVVAFLVPDLGRTKLHRLTARQVRHYLGQLEARGTGVRTIRYVHATLRAALEDAMREELLEKNIAKLVRPPATPKIERQPLTVDELRELFEKNESDRLRAMLIVIALLGLRRSELLALQWSEVDLEFGTMEIRHGLHRINGQLQIMPTKTARSRRTIPMPSFVVQELQRHRHQQERERDELATKWPDLGYVFTTPIGTPIDPDNCSKFVQRAIKQADLRPVRMHDFRHGLISTLLGLGVPPRTVMEIAGHSGLEMTMNIYAHVTLDDKRAALSRFDEMFGKGEK